MAQDSTPSKSRIPIIPSLHLYCVKEWQSLTGTQGADTPKTATPSSTSSTPSVVTPTQPTVHEPLPEPLVEVLLQAWDEHEWNHSAKAITDWLNARWAKTGYKVSEQTVCFHLREHHRDARLGLGDELGGSFVRE